MNKFKRIATILTLVATTLLSACSKTVQWEEEVPLNTGETIWVKRTDTYRRGSEPGNPLQLVWLPKSRALEFSWHGQHYKYHTDTTDIMMLYGLVVPKSIAIVAWTKNCAKPGYGEFQWANDGWHLQPNVSSVLIGKSRNLMSYYSAAEGDIPVRASNEFKRNSRFDLPQRGGEESHLLESRVATNCSRSK